jgi:uncharacterized protein (TIGR03435 family)
MRAFPVVTVIALSSFVAFAQSTPARKFDVASVKPIPESQVARQPAGERGSGRGCPAGIRVNPAHVEFRCSTLLQLMGYAFRISPDRISGPDWITGIGSPRFNIAAALPEGTSKDDIPEMLQTLLAERFQLVVHRAVANKSIYALVRTTNVVIMKQVLPSQSPGTPSIDGESPEEVYGETQLRTSSDSGGVSVTLISNPRMGTVRQTGDPYKGQRWEASSISMAGLADLLDKVAPLSLPILDMTNVPGRFEIVLEVSLPPPATLVDEPAAQSRAVEMEEAVLRAFNNGLKKLSLRLERRSGPVETIMVDRAVKTPLPN